MRTMERYVGLAGVVAWVALCGFTWGRPTRDVPAEPRTVRPAPTEVRGSIDEESGLQERRAEWIESRHVAAPGVDWRELEAVHRRRLILSRQGEIESGIRSNLWDELGSRDLAGRTWVTALDPVVDGQIWSGSDNGGVWRGNLDGSGWTAMSDGVGRAVHYCAVVPGSPKTVVIANSNEIHTSTNDGATWFTPGGMPDQIYDTIRLFREPGTVRVYAFLDSRIASARNLRLYRSTNGGLDFSVVQTLALSPGADIWTSRTVSGPLYLMQGQTCKRSTDFGVTFTTVGTAPVAANRAILVGSEAGAPTLYAALRVGSNYTLYRSSDAGASWASRSAISDFYGTLHASITNSNVVHWGGVEAHRSTDGGVSFGIVNAWWQYYDDPLHKLHADIFGMDSHIYAGNEVMFYDTDGGTYISNNTGATVTNISLQNLGISQYYGIQTSPNNPWLVAAGAQDQGFQVSQPGLGTPFMSFVQTVSGDYGHLTSRDGTHNMLYSVYPGFTLLQESEVNPYSLFFVDFPPATGGVTFLPFVHADPDDSDVYWFCANHIWRSERVSGETYSNTELPHDFATSGASYVGGMGISPADHQYWYAVTNNGRIFWSHDHGANWALGSTSGPGSHYFYGTAVLCSPTDRDVCYIGGSGYSNPGVWKSVDGGATWTAVGTGLPATLIYGLDFDNPVDQNLYAATEHGPYRYDAGTDLWEYIGGTEAPITVYWDVEGVAALGVVRFATYGRGIWDYTIPGPADVAEGPVAGGPKVRLYPNPARSEATLEYAASRGGAVKVELFDVLGRRVLAPTMGTQHAPAGSLRLDLRYPNGRPLEAGVYLVRVTTAEGTTVQSLRVEH